MIFHIAVCSPDPVLRGRVQRHCMEYYARRADACIVEQLESTAALLQQEEAGSRYELYLMELPAANPCSGLQAAADLGSGLAKNGAIIVSGLADGLDSAGHRAAVKENCPTIGVLGVPIDRTYPASNRELRKKIEQKGCVISEYPPESGPVGPNGFLQRNRLIAALSSALVVVEAQEKSGTMSTVNHAERYGKPVFAVPGSIYSPNSAGTNALLREGRAKAVCKPGDLFGVLGLRGAAAPAAVRSAPDPMSETERRVLACIGPKAKGVEELGAASGLPTGLLLGTLMKLELAGRVTCLPGKRYILR